MGIFDFFNNKKNARQEQLRLQEEKRRAEEQRRLAERRKQEEQQRREESFLSNFEFDSTCHQRYENGQPVRGLQVCPRYIKIKKNINGCSGYQLTPGDGYILTATNGDTGQPQFAPKPMRVVKFSNTEILLKGYCVSAQTPFGWQEVDYSDYGFIVSNKNGKVDKCILHMYDRDTYIEYRRSQTPQHTEETVSKNIQEIVDAATVGLVAAQQGNHRIEQENLIKLFNLTQNKSSQLLHIPTEKYNLVGTGFGLLLEYPQVKANEDVSRAIADYAFFCISKAIENDPGNKALHLKRISVVAQTRDFFFYTVANALEIPDSNPLDIMLSAPLIVRTNDYIYAMGKYDFENGNKIAFEGILKKFHELCYGQYVRKTAEEGKIYIDKVNEYIANSISEPTLKRSIF